VLARDFLLPAWLVVGGSGTKFSLLGENRSKRAVSGVLGEFCTVTGPACGTKFSLLGLLVGVSAKKFALRVQNGPKSAVCGVLGEFFRENTVVGAVPGELFRGNNGEGPVLGELCRA